MKILLALIFILSSVGCSNFPSGDIIIYGNLFEQDCSIPRSNAKVFLVDAIYLPNGSLENEIRLDSVTTDTEGSFEFVYGSYEVFNDPGLWIETEELEFYVKIQPSYFTRHINLMICEDI